ncbi:MAG: hypothetical protein IT317_05060 [Anaerolineales bacterium]|nr:hypothetical protein [Anaerolineales bacterium]
MFREDYIVRMIAQAAAAVTYILDLTRAERYPEALAEVEKALQLHLGLSLGLVTALPAGGLVELARQGEMLEVGKLVVLADLLQAEGDIYAARGQAAEAADGHAKALELYLEVSVTGENARGALAERVTSLAAKLPPGALAPDVEEWLAFVQAGAPPAAPDAPDTAA